MNTETIMVLVEDKRVQIVAASMLSAVAGAFGGYSFAKNKLKTHYEAIAMQEIEEAKNFYGSLHKTDDESSPEKVLEKLHGPKAVEALKAHRSYLGVVESPAATEADLMLDPMDAETNGLGEDPADENIHVSIFDQAEEGYIFEKEVLLRSETEPYIITEEEYLANENDYEQTALTYFEEDSVLVDDEDMPIPDSHSLIGDDHLVRFGHGSKNENVVFVRNDRIEMEFEIERSFGSFTKEVAGFDEEDGLKHSAVRGPRKFRGHDD